MRLSKIATAVFVGISIAGCGTTSPTSSQPSATSSVRGSTSEDPTAVCAHAEPEGEQFEITIETVSFAFDTDRVEGPRACQPFAIAFENHDELNPAADPAAGLTNQHDIDIRAGFLGPKVFDGKLINGPQGSIRYEVPGLSAGEYIFYCSVHPNMNGTLVVAEH
jgi:hypothetical protein